MTNKHIYVPQFEKTLEDDEAINTIKTYTNKALHRVNCKGVCALGGNLRCLSW